MLNKLNIGTKTIKKLICFKLKLLFALFDVAGFKILRPTSK